VSWEEWAKTVGARLDMTDKSIMSLNTEIQLLWESIWSIQTKLRVMERPIVKTRILNLLAGEDKPHAVYYIAKRVDGYTFEALRELVEDGVLEETWSGTHLMYGLGDGAKKCRMCQLVVDVKAGRPIPTKLHFHDRQMIIVDCYSCKPSKTGAFHPKMVVYTKHGMRPLSGTIALMRARASRLFPGRPTLVLMRTLNGHYYFYVK